MSLTKEEVLDLVEKNAFEAQKRDDVCARSAMYGLKSGFDFIPEEMVTATQSLAGGTGAGSGSCGAYCSGLLAVGLKYNATMAEEAADPSVKMKGIVKFKEYRDRFLKEFGTILCPEIHRQLFGKAFYLPKEEGEFFSIPDHAEKCAYVAGKAARIAAEMLLEDED